MARLICISSNSSGNSFAIDIGSEILLLEAGVKLSEVQKCIDFNLDRSVGCLISHVHGDHAKYSEDYAKHGVPIFCNGDVAEKKEFAFGSACVLKEGETVSIGSFRVSPILLYHDVPNYGYIVYHKEMGCLLFASDTYKMDAYIHGIDHWLIEANYDDRILKVNVEDGKIDRAQANRLMLSHMSIDNTVHYLHECEAEKSHNIILCHLSERNSDPDAFKNRVVGEFGVPTYIASRGLTVELDNELI